MEAIEIQQHTFRKKPVLIRAVRLTREMIEAHVFDRAPLPPGCLCTSSSSHPPTRQIYAAAVVVKTLEGNMLANPGDWIITGVKGEVYPCKDDIFRATYDPVGVEAESAMDEGLENLGATEAGFVE